MPRAGEPLGGARLHATGNAADLRRALALSPTPAAHTGGRLIYQADGRLAMVAAADKKRPFKLVAMFRPESVTTQSATPTARMASFAGTSSSVSSNREVLSEEVLMMPFHVGRTPITRWCASGTRDWSKEFPRSWLSTSLPSATAQRQDARPGVGVALRSCPARPGPPLRALQAPLCDRPGSVERRTRPVQGSHRHAVRIATPHLELGERSGYPAPRKGTHVPSIDFTDPRGDLRGGRATRGTGRPSRRGPRPRHDARSQP
jgi:hypothetical protein